MGGGVIEIVPISFREEKETRVEGSLSAKDKSPLKNKVNLAKPRFLKQRGKKVYQRDRRYLEAGGESREEESRDGG